jgi:ribosome recycling factor
MEAFMLKEVYKEAETRMKGAIQSLEEDLSGIRTGRAHPALVEKLPVEYYGTPTPLVQLASISVPEPRSLLIKPFDPSTLKTIERSILASDLGLTPQQRRVGIHPNRPLDRRRRRALCQGGTSPPGRQSAVRNVRRYD